MSFSLLVVVSIIVYCYLFKKVGKVKTNSIVALMEINKILVSLKLLEIKIFGMGIVIFYYSVSLNLSGY